MIKFVYFDVGRVFFTWDDYYANLSNLVGFDIETIKSVFREIDDVACRGKISIEEITDLYRKRLNLPKDINRIDDYFSKFHKRIEPTHRLFDKVIKEYKVGLLTNIWGSLYENAQRMQTVPNESNFHNVIRSNVVGLIKPEREIFDLATLQAQELSSEIFFIDDNVKNIEAANEYGWQTHLFQTDRPEESVKMIEEILLL